MRKERCQGQRKSIEIFFIGEGTWRLKKEDLGEKCNLLGYAILIRDQEQRNYGF